MKYALAIGYPLRLCIEQGRTVQEVELQKCRLILSLEQAQLWGTLSMWRELSEEEKPAVEELAALGAAILGDSAMEILSELVWRTPLRQGFCMPSEEGSSIQLGKERFLLTGLQEQLWISADGRDTLDEIFKKLEIHWRDSAVEQLELILENLLGLTVAELCYYR